MFVCNAVRRTQAVRGYENHFEKLRNKIARVKENGKQFLEVYYIIDISHISDMTQFKSSQLSV